MKPIIVTYSNESYVLDAVTWGLLTLGGALVKNICGGTMFCTKLISHSLKTLHMTEVKLIARPKRKTL